MTHKQSKQNRAGRHADTAEVVSAHSVSAANATDGRAQQTSSDPADRPAPVQEVLAELRALYPEVQPGLTFDNPFQLLVATVLSAQTTDARVNMVTPELFERFPAPHVLAQAEPAVVADIIRSVGFFRTKAKNIVALAQMLCDTYDGQVPQTLPELVTLPGVGRKTANVVLGNAFGIPGITVDTHVGRLSRRWGWTRHTDPVKAERDLMALVPQEIWTDTSHRMIYHGRRVCHSRRPDCEHCTLRRLCPSALN